MNIRNIRILGTGKYLPENICTSLDLDHKLGKNSGWVERKSGVRQRHFSSPSETSSDMAAKAIHQAMEHAQMTTEEIDCIVGACAVMEQALPGTSCAVQHKLKLNSIPCFDVNSSCLSFVTALDMISYAMQSGRFKNVVLFSSEKASLGLNWEDCESCTIFGDGAAAVVVAKSEVGESGKILASYMQTYSRGYNYCQIQGGGTKVHPRFVENAVPYFLFEMNGKAALKVVVKHIDDFLRCLLAQANLKMEDIDWIIPHQASKLSLQFLRKKLNIPKEKVIDILATHGNQVAASIPTALHEGIQSYIKRGDKVLLIGSSAGISLGGMILEY